MADKGAYTYTVQEAENIGLGQLGAILTKSAEDAITPPDGHVFVAIQVITNYGKFTSSTGLLAEDSNKWANTAASSQGGASSDNGGETLDNAISFPAGVHYGRWNKIDVHQGVIIAYIGK
mgnify:CR=1 FL=1